MHSVNGSRGASALKKRRPFNALAASQLPPAVIMETACQGDLVFFSDPVCFTMARNLGGYNSDFAASAYERNRMSQSSQ